MKKKTSQCNWLINLNSGNADALSNWWMRWRSKLNQMHSNLLFTSLLLPLGIIWILKFKSLPHDYTLRKIVETMGLEKKKKIENKMKTI